MLLVGDNEVERDQPCLDELIGMLPTSEEILLADLGVELLRGETIHAAGCVVFAPGGVPAALQFFSETTGSVAPLRSRAIQELP